MLSMYVALNDFWMSNIDSEDALYESLTIRRFVGISLVGEAAPSAATH